MKADQPEQIRLVARTYEIKIMGSRERQGEIESIPKYKVARLGVGL